MAAFSTGLDKDRHHNIFKKVVGTVIMLPSESGGVIVNHEDKAGLRVSCIIKKTVRRATAQWQGVNAQGNRWYPEPKEFELATPTLMYSASYGHYDGTGTQSLALTDVVRQQPHGGEVAFVVLNEDSENNIMVKPYRIGNVYDGGNICWGGNLPPKNLRETHNLFWSSGINTDFGGPKHTRRCKNVTHVYQSHETPNMLHRHEHLARCRNGMDCEDKNAVLVKMQGPWSSDHPRPSKCLYCGGVLTKHISEEQSEILTKVGSLCLCCASLCSEASGCTCCCHCCQNQCNCLCECDLTDEWIEQMKGYEESLHHIAWEDWTRMVCGRKWNTEKPKFFSYNGHCDAIFISYDEDLIKKVGKENVRKHYTWDAVIGLATMTKDGWEIDYGNGKLMLGKNKVVPLADKWETPEVRRIREEREYAERQREARRIREHQRAERQERDRKRVEREAMRARVIAERIERGEVSQRDSAVDLWRRFYLNENNSSWWQAPENTESTAVVATNVEVVRTWTS